MIQLVKRSISGDADAFLELMEKNSLAMYKVARGILDNDEDAQMPCRIPYLPALKKYIH